MAERLIDFKFGPPTAVYVLLDKDGVVLYVGISINVENRFKAHHIRHWWPLVASTRIEHFDDHWSAQQRELVLIRDLQPIHNIQHNTDRAAA